VLFLHQTKGYARSHNIIAYEEWACCCCYIINTEYSHQEQDTVMEDITHKFTINSGDNDSSDEDNSDGDCDRVTDNEDVKLFTSNVIPL
jgi:hypothetical protein